MDWSEVRQQFPALQNWTYLNTAAFGQLPQAATEAVTRHFAHRDEFACADFLDWFDDMNGVRRDAAALVNADPDDIAFISNAASALSLLLSGMPWTPGDRIVTLAHEFPNNLYAPSLLGTEGVEFIETDWDRFYEVLTPQTRLVIVSTVNYNSGFRAPLAEMSACLRERGIKLYVDSTQSLGALPFDMRQIRPDLFAVHGYKWLLCPNGAGFMVVPPETRAWLAPHVVGWRSHQDWRSVDNLHHGIPQFPSGAERYEGGMINFALLYAMGASIRMMLELDPACIEQRVLTLAEQTRLILRRHGATIVGDGSPHYQSPIIAARFDGQDASALARALREQRVLVSARRGNLRVSTHFYNNEEDLARLDGVLRERF